MLPHARHDDGHGDGASLSSARRSRATRDWDEIFEGKESEVDWPASYHWRELIDVYPDAKVLLSVRSADSWVRSMQNTINQVFFGDSLMTHLAKAQYHIDPTYAAWIDLLTEMNLSEERGAFGTSGDPGSMAEAMERWNQAVNDTVPAERLLVWDPKDGWEPLCEFLEVPVPGQPLPHVNDTENFQKNLIMGPAIAAINGWWEENRPPEDPADKRPAGPALIGVAAGPGRLHLRHAVAAAVDDSRDRARRDR